MNNEIFELYDNVREAAFVKRLNRFVMKLKLEGKEIDAYIANPGRMVEYLVPGHPFYITSGNEGKFEHRVVSTRYQDSYALLDTIKINRLVERMLEDDRIPELAGPKEIRREYTVDSSKFDFLITFTNSEANAKDTRKPVLLEIKSCSLCHNKIAMFPDAPTTRGKRHLEDLNGLAQTGEYDCYTLYLITNEKAELFLPNGHTDPEYCDTFNKSNNIRFLAYSIAFKDPVNVDLSTLKNVPIGFEKAKELCSDKGTYLLIFYNDKPLTTVIGSLGQRKFHRGYYVYVGSAQNGLEKRIRRHLSPRKQLHWHLDYISPKRMKPVNTLHIRGEEAIEEALAFELTRVGESHVPGFGSSDTKAESHFFFFKDDPMHNRKFLNILLDFRHR